MRVHLINPSDLSFGTAVITPRWMYVLAGATPKRFGDPILFDETLTPFNPNSVDAGDVVSIGIHTANALRGYQIGKAAHARGVYVIFGGIHATLYPQEPFDLGGAHGVVQGDGDMAWATVLSDCLCGNPKPIYAGGRIEADDFVLGLLQSNEREQRKFHMNVAKSRKLGLFSLAACIAATAYRS